MDETIADSLLVSYRCPCGEEFRVSANDGGECPECDRRVSSAALQDLVSSTVSFIEHEHFTAPALSEADPWIGRQLGHFKIIERLGGGGMGAVYRALDCSLQRYVAVKLIRSNSNESPNGRKTQSLLQEAVAQARVHHPNVVTIYYVSQDQETPFLAMELMNGTITAILGRGNLSFSTVVDIAIQVTQALKASYQLDIIHGDIKPSNLLIDRLGTVKLSDFGLARRTNEQDEEQQGLRGTPNYLSPALMSGHKPNMHSDMYALGITFYELTFGKPPQILEGTSVQKWLNERSQLVLLAPHSGMHEIPRDWLPILNRLLESDPKKAFQSYDELLACLATAKPSSEMAAGRLPRLVAWAVDQVVIASVAMGLATLFDSLGRTLPWMLWPLIFLLPAIAYIGLCSRWGKSLGYFAMQLRLIDASGMSPTRNTWLIRELFRTLVFWIFMTCVPGLGSGMTQQPVYLIAGVIWTLFFVDVTAIVFPGSECLHDRFLRTRVVLRRVGH